MNVAEQTIGETEYTRRPRALHATTLHAQCVKCRALRTRCLQTPLVRKDCAAVVHGQVNLHKEHWALGGAHGSTIEQKTALHHAGSTVCPSHAGQHEQASSDRPSAIGCCSTPLGDASTPSSPRRAADEDSSVFGNTAHAHPGEAQWCKKHGPTIHSALPV